MTRPLIFGNPLRPQSTVRASHDAESSRPSASASAQTAKATCACGACAPGTTIYDGRMPIESHYGDICHLRDGVSVNRDSRATRPSEAQTATPRPWFFDGASVRISADAPPIPWAEVCKRCDLHDELVAALELAAKAFCSGPYPGDTVKAQLRITNDARKAIRAVLEKAKPERSDTP